LSQATKPGAAGPAATTTTTTSTSTSTTTTTSTTAPKSGTTTTTTTVPVTGTTTTTTPTTYADTGQYLSQTVTLTQLTSAGEPSGSSSLIGQLSDFTTTDPSLACLTTETSLDVYQFAQLPSVYVVVAAEPTDCTDAEFSFPIPETTSSSGSGSGSGPGSGSNSGTGASTDPSSGSDSG
jgi:hypothetical protein